MDHEQIPEEVEGEDVEVAWPNDVLLCTDLVYRISVYNDRDRPVKVTLGFTPAEPG